MVLLAPAEAIKAREGRMQLTPREFDKLLIYMVADVALKRKAQWSQAKLSRSGRRHMCGRSRWCARWKNDRRRDQ
jgi:hypothetical protein